MFRNLRVWTIAGIVVLIALAAKLDALCLPFYWDEQAYVLPSHWLSTQGLMHILPGMHPVGTFFGHPPLLYLLFAVQFKVFGESLWIPHTIILLFSLTCVTFTYRLGCLLSDWYGGILAALFTCCVPLFYTQSVMVLGDIPITALGVMTVYYFLTGRDRWYFLAATVMLLSKATALAIVVSCAIYAALGSTTRERTGGWKAAVYYSLPLAALGLFFLLEQLSAGTPVTNPYFQKYEPLLRVTSESFSTSLLAVVGNCKQVGWATIFSERKWSMVLVGIIGLLATRGRLWRREFTLFVMIIFFFIAAFSLIFFLQRYLLPTLPFLAVICASIASEIFRVNRMFRVGVPLVIVMLLLIGLKKDCSRFGSLEKNLCYADAVRSDAKAARLRAAAFPGEIGAGP